MLKTKQVGKYTVSQRGPLQNCRVRVFHARVEKLFHVPQKDEELSDEQVAYNDFLLNWVAVAACTEPLITLEQFGSDPDLDEVVLAVDEVNEIQTGDGPQSKKKPQPTI